MSFPGRLSLRARAGLVLLALLPAVLVAWRHGDASIGLRLSLAVVAALTVEGLLLAWGRHALRSPMTDLSTPLYAVLLVLSVPATVDTRLLLAGVVLAIGLAKVGFGGLGSHPFHPAMAGAAFILMVPGPGSRPDDFPSLALAYVLGGLALIAARQTSWQAPAGFLCGLGAAAAVTGDLENVPFAASALAAFFVVTDHVSGSLYPRGRAIFGAGCGLLGLLFCTSGTAGNGFPFAVLLMNAVAPWLDRHTSPPRIPAQAQP